MKIQESPYTCDTGRVSGGEVRGSDTDCEKTSCEDVPRLDLTALTEDNNWGGEAGGHLNVVFRLSFFLHATLQMGLILSAIHIFLYEHTCPDNPLTVLHPALHMGVWVAAAHLLLPLLLLLLLMQLLLPLLQDLIVKDPLKFFSDLYLEEKHWRCACLLGW